MNWPNHADYAEAVQNPELCFELPELHTGVVATSPLGLPRVLSGNFASVYEITGGGETFAVRCFVRQVTNQQDRYAALERHLAGHDLPCMVPFEFVTRGIRVHERWFPIVKMNWVSGVPLHTYVEQQLPSPEKLAWLAADWREMMAALKPLRIGHGDLQHGNVLVTAGGELRLVDYDGLYVPLFARERSPELGHANYQHPLRAPEFYDERLDHFPELLIYLSLRALAAEPALWGEFFNGDNLIVTAVDLRVPQCSSLWPRLLKSPDEDVRRLTVLLVESLQLAPVDVPDLETALTERLPQVVVPAELGLTGPPVTPAWTRDGESSVTEVATEIDAFARRLDGPLAAMNIERTSAGSRPAPPTPRVVDVLAWSALVAALLALVPPLRPVAALTAVGLGVLAGVLPGRLWQRVRLVAAVAVLLSGACLLVDYRIPVAARLPAAIPPWPAEPVEAKNAGAIPAPDAPVPLLENLPATNDAEIKPVPREVPQAVSRPLHEPVKAPLAAVVRRWRPHGETVSALLPGVDHRHVISAGTDRTLAVGDLVQGRTIFVRTNLAEPVVALTTLTNVGIVAAVDAMHQLQWWSLDGGLPLKTLALDPDSLVAPRLSPDGQVIAAGGRDRRQVVLQAVGASVATRTLAGFSSWARLARFTPDGRRLAVACLDDTIYLRRVDSGGGVQSLSFPDAAIAGLEFSPDGRRLLAVGEQGQVRLWNSTTGDVVAAAKLPLAQPFTAWLEDPARVRAVVAAGQRVLVLSLAAGVVIEEELRSSVPVTAIASLPSGTGFVTGHANGELSIWQFQSTESAVAAKLVRP